MEVNGVTPSVINVNADEPASISIEEAKVESTHHPPMDSSPADNKEPAKEMPVKRQYGPYKRNRGFKKRKTKKQKNRIYGFQLSRPNPVRVVHLPPPEPWQPSRLRGDREKVRNRIAVAMEWIKKDTRNMPEPEEPAEPIGIEWVSPEVDVEGEAQEHLTCAIVRVKDEPDLYPDMENEAQEHFTGAFESVKEEWECDDSAPTTPPPPYAYELPHKRRARLQRQRKKKVRARPTQEEKREMARRWRANEKPEKRAARKEREAMLYRQRRLNETEEAKRARVEKRNQQRRARYAKLTPEERYAKVEHERNRKRLRELELTPEERLARAERRRAIRAERDNKRKTEMPAADRAERIKQMKEKPALLAEESEEQKREGNWKIKTKSWYLLKENENEYEEEDPLSVVRYQPQRRDKYPTHKDAAGDKLWNEDLIAGKEVFVNCFFRY